MSRPRALLATAMLVFADVLLVGCSSPSLPSLPTMGEGDAATDGGDEPELDAATDAGDGAPASGNDAGPTCIVEPPANGAVSSDCFPYETCTSCGVPGIDYWCSDDAGAGAHPNLAGCLTDPGAMSGWTGACCPGSAACVRLSDDDNFCAAQGLPGNAWSCPYDASTNEAAVTPNAPGCLPSGTAFAPDGGPVLPSGGAAGAGLAPAQSTSLYCCQGG